MFHNVAVGQAQALIDAGVEVIDVRDASEWATGHVPGARLMTLEQLRNGAFRENGQPGVLFVCAGGLRSQTAARTVSQLGATVPVYSLTGGTQAWARAGLPVSRALGIAV